MAFCMFSPGSAIVRSDVEPALREAAARLGLATGELEAQDLELRADLTLAIDNPSDLPREPSHHNCADICCRESAICDNRLSGCTSTPEAPHSRRRRDTRGANNVTPARASASALSLRPTFISSPMHQNPSICHTCSTTAHATSSRHCRGHMRCHSGQCCVSTGTRRLPVGWSSGGPPLDQCSICSVPLKPQEHRKSLQLSSPSGIDLACRVHMLSKGQPVTIELRSAV